MSFGCWVFDEKTRVFPKTRGGFFLVVVRLLRVTVLLEVSEEGHGGLDGHSLAFLVGRVLVALPPEERLRRDKVVGMQGLEYLDQKFCKKKRKPT